MHLIDLKQFMPSLPFIARTSNNMMGSVVSRTAQAVRPHIPLIKFPPRSTVNASKGATSSPNPEQLKPVSSQPLKGKVIDPLNLPRKYHRKPISVEEMEYIEKGGPV